MTTTTTTTITDAEKAEFIGICATVIKDEGQVRIDFVVKGEVIGWVKFDHDQLSDLIKNLQDKLTHLPMIQ